MSVTSRRELLRRVGLVGATALAAACTQPTAQAPTAAPAAKATSAPPSPPSASPKPAAPAGSPQSAASPAVAAKPASGDPYSIGVTYPLTGPQAAFGTQLIPAIEVAVDDVNKAGGIKGRPLRIVVEDSKSTPEGGVAAMRKVVDIDKVPGVITIFTNIVTAQIPLADQLKIPFLCPVEAPGVVSKSQWAFAYAPTYDFALPLLVEHWQKIGIKRLFGFFPNNAIADFFSPLTKDAAQKIGAAYDEARYKLGDTDFRGIAARARDFNPDAIIINGQGTPDDGVLMAQLREVGVNAPFFAGSNNFSLESWRRSAGQYAENMVFAGFVLDREKARDFVAAYKAKTNIEPSQVAVQVYDQLKMMAYAIDQKGYTAEGIRDALTNLKGFTSVNGGTVDMGQDHQARPPVGLYRVTGDQPVRIQPGG